MAQDAHVERIAKQLDKMVQRKSTDGALCLLQELRNTKMSLETLQSTRVGMSVNAVRKLSSEDEVQTLAKVLIKSWKKLIDGAEKICVEVKEEVKEDKKEEKEEKKEKEKEKEKKEVKEEKKKEEPVRSSSTSKDTGQEKSCMGTDPQSPAPSFRTTSFPAATVTTDGVRNKCRELLMAALQTDGDFRSSGVDCSLLAAQIEDHIFQEFHCTDVKYKSRLRSRISNLKDQKNPELRRSVLRGDIRPQRIATMTAQDMASAEMRTMREALTKESIREHQLCRVGGTDTDMFHCSKCKSNDCTYNQVQIRSADEPMTTFVVCNNCGNRWKI